jgi:hypothetical protein
MVHTFIHFILIYVLQVISNNNTENYRGHYAQSVGVHSLAVYPALQPSMPTPSTEANKGSYIWSFYYVNLQAVH